MTLRFAADGEPPLADIVTNLRALEEWLRQQADDPEPDSLRAAAEQVREFANAVETYAGTQS